LLVLLAALLRRHPAQGRLRVALLACLAVLAAAACGGAEDEAAVEAAVPLKLGYSDWPGWVAWEIAKEKGFFEKNGVAVELVWMDYVASMEAFAAGALDAVSMTNGDALVSGATAKKPSTAILVNDYSNGNDMVVAGPGLASLRDLRGKKIGVEVGFVDHLLLLHALESAGIAPSDVEFVNVPTNELPQALAAGGVDAISAWQPASGQALKIVSGSTPVYTSAEAPGIIYDMLQVSRESLSARRADWLNVVRTWYDVVDYMSDPANKAEMLGILSARVGLTPEEYEPLLAGTYILPLPEAIAVLTGSADLAFESVAGSSTAVDAFNVENQVYPALEYAPAYLDPSLTLEVAEERGEKAPGT
jgi:NitT/TauT family transport system substrate-binding protein